MKRLIFFLMMGMMGMMLACSSDKGESTAELTSAEKGSLKLLNQVKVTLNSNLESDDTSNQVLASSAFSSTTFRTVNVSLIEPNLGQFSYNDSLSDLGENHYVFVNKDPGSIKDNNEYVAFTAVNHGESLSKFNDGMDGYIWYQDFIVKDYVSSSIIASYLLLDGQTIVYESDILYVKKSDGSKVQGISKLQLGNSSNRCEYTFSPYLDIDTKDNVEVTFTFSSCPLEIKAYDSIGDAHEFSGRLDGFSISFDLPYGLDSDDFNNSKYEVERPLYNSSGDRVGFYRLNIISGQFSVVDNNKQTL